MYPYNFLQFLGEWPLSLFFKMRNLLGAVSDTIILMPDFYVSVGNSTHNSYTATFWKVPPHIMEWKYMPPMNTCHVYLTGHDGDIQQVNVWRPFLNMNCISFLLTNQDLSCDLILSIKVTWSNNVYCLVGILRSSNSLWYPLSSSSVNYKVQRIIVC